MVLISSTSTPFTGGQDAVCAALHREVIPLIVDGQGEGDLRLVAVALLPSVCAGGCASPQAIRSGSGIPVVDVAVRRTIRPVRAPSSRMTPFFQKRKYVLFLLSI